MEENTVVVIRFEGRFQVNTEGHWGYIGGKTKVKLMQTNCTYDELLHIVYEATNINPEQFRIKMKFIVHSIYQLDPIEIENDGDVKCFFMERFRVDTSHASPLFIEVEMIEEQDNAIAIPFASRSGSNRLSLSRHIVEVNRSGIRGSQEDQIPQNEGEVNNLVDSSAVNLPCRVQVHGTDDNNIVPMIDEHNRLHNADDFGIECNNDTNGEWQEYEDEDISLYEDTTVNNDWRGDDNELDTTSPIHVTNINIPHVPVVNSPTIPSAPISNNRVMQNSIRPESQSQPTHTVFYQSVNHTSTSSNELSSSMNQSMNSSDEISVGQIYSNKKELQQKLSAYALKENFEFKVKKSCSQRFEVQCVHDNCTWRLRATRIPSTEYWAVKVFIKVHKCSQLEQVHPQHRQASSKYIGNHIKLKYQGISRQYRPKDIVDDVEQELGIRISYDKAWRARESALHSIRGTPEESYRILPLWCSMLGVKNPGTITRIATDEDNCFLYFFMALGQSIVGFSMVRPVIAVDGTHLKGKYMGTLLIASCLDGNEQIYPLAFGIVDTESETSYTWFLQQFKEAYGEIQDLVFITDRHKGLEKAITTVYPTAHHGHCMYHLSCNVKLHFGKNKYVFMAFYQAAKAYLHIDFDMYMRQLEAIDVRAHKYLMEANPEKWARAFFPSNRYNIMTTNIVECMNAVLRDARALPLIPLLEAIRALVQGWFYNRRNESETATTPVMLWLEKILIKRLNECHRFTVTPLSMYEFQVRTFDLVMTVNLEDKTCSCRQFQLDQFPCIHAIAACRFRNLSPYSFCSEYYNVSSWRACYAATIYPLDDRHMWTTPSDIIGEVIKPPVLRRSPGRPRTRRILSKGEERLSRKCSRCGVFGHNRQTCTGNIPL